MRPRVGHDDLSLAGIWWLSSCGGLGFRVAIVFDGGPWMTGRVGGIRCPEIFGVRRAQCVAQCVGLAALHDLRLLDPRLALEFFQIVFGGGPVWDLHEAAAFFADEVDA